MWTNQRFRLVNRLSEVPDRDKFIISTTITVILTVVPLVIAIAFWAWSSPDVINTSPVGAIKALNEYLLYGIEIILMTGTFAFFIVTVLNLKFGLTGRRGGWSEVITSLLIIGVLTYAMFGIGVAGATTVLSIGFVVYLYLLQE